MHLTKARLARLAAVLVLMAASLLAVAPPATAEQASGIPGPPRAATTPEAEAAERGGSG